MKTKLIARFLQFIALIGILSFQTANAQNPVTITLSTSVQSSGFFGPFNTFSINQTIANTIQSHLNSGTSVLVETPNSSTFSGIALASGVSILKTSGGDATLTFKAGGFIDLSSNNTIESTSGKLNLVFWCNWSGNGGVMRFGTGSTNANVLIKTNGGNLWVGGGSGSTTWNGLTVGNGYARGGIGGNSAWWGLEMWFGVRIFTNGGNVSLNGSSEGVCQAYGIRMLRSLINSNNGNIDVSTDVTGATSSSNCDYSAGVYISGDGGFSTTSGNITINNVVKGVSTTSAGVFLERTADGLPLLVSTQGNVSVNNNFSASSAHKWAIDINELILTREKAQTATSFTEAIPSILQGSTTTFSSSQTNVATVNNTGLVTIAGVGNSDITGVFSRSDWSPLSSRWRYKIGVVNKADPNLTFANAEVFKNLSDPSFTITATQQNQGGGSYGGISYTSSNRSVATVNASTGLVTIVGEGSTVISATSASTVTYTQGSASYTLYVTNGLVVLTTNSTNNNGIVTVSGNVVSDGGNSVTERGFVYATTTSPTISNTKIVIGSGTGTFSGNTPSLTPGTYYFRAFATNGLGTIYGSQLSEVVSTPLPVTWLSFTGKRTQQGVELNWSTSSEQNTKDFEVQHSINVQQWTSVGNLPAVGNSNTVRNYRFVHEGPFKNSIQHYYRILQRDLDGKFSYSKVIRIEYPDAATDVVLYPNPASDLLHINLTERQELRLVNMQGVVVWKGVLPAGRHEIQVSSFAAGNYILQAGKGTYKVMIQ